MKYEIINPSDKCYITTDIPVVAAICCGLIGRGTYGLWDETGNRFIQPMVPIEKQLNITNDEMYALLKKHNRDIYECFRSFEYDTEPTSCNDIGARAKSWADLFEKTLRGK